MGDHVLFPDTSSTWTAALLTLCFKLIALCGDVAAVIAARGETDERDPTTRGRRGRENITVVIIYVFRSQLHSKHSSGDKYGSMQTTNTTSIKGFTKQALQREIYCMSLFCTEAKIKQGTHCTLLYSSSCPVTMNHVQTIIQSLFCPGFQTVTVFYQEFILI